MNLRQQLRGFWKYLRRVSGDDAYERYLAHHQRLHMGGTALTRQEFFQRQQEDKWSKISRCC
jgi:uncharacterized short protein YbdD (DUF466 family)